MMYCSSNPEMKEVKLNEIILGYYIHGNHAESVPFIFWGPMTYKV